VLATVRPLTAAPRDDRPRAEPRPSGRRGPAHPADAPRPRPEPTPIRIGIRRLEDASATYLAYLTRSAHRDYFRAEWWPSSRSITPVHLWRANHLGASWDVESVARFMEVAAAQADDLVATAPRSAPVGGPERRAWLARFVRTEWVGRFGIGRVSKTLHALLPELLPDLDPTMMSWARRSWFGLDGVFDPDAPDAWIEVGELLEDVLVLRAQPLDQIVRRLRRVAPGLGPVSRMGPVLAALWQGFWSEADTARPPGDAEETAPSPATADAPAPRSPRKRSATATGERRRSRSEATTSRPRRTASTKRAASPSEAPEGVATAGTRTRARGRSTTS
jgi:hypothetical protein